MYCLIQFDVGLFGAIAVMACTEEVADVFEQLGHGEVPSKSFFVWPREVRPYDNIAASRVTTRRAKITEVFCSRHGFR